MKQIISSLFIVLLVATAASGEIIAEWRSDVSGEYNIYTLTVTPTENEIIAAFDLMVTGSDFEYLPSCVIYDARDLNTHFLFSLYSEGNNGEAIPNLAVVASAVGENYLAGAFNTSFYGINYPGWNSAVDLLQIVVPTASGVTPENSLTLRACDHDFPCILLDDVSATIVPIHLVPEPGTMALLAAGLIGLVVYAWRRRK